MSDIGFDEGSSQEKLPKTVDDLIDYLHLERHIEIPEGSDLRRLSDRITDIHSARISIISWDNDLGPQGLLVRVINNDPEQLLEASTRLLVDKDGVLSAALDIRDEL